MNDAMHTPDPLNEARAIRACHRKLKDVLDSLDFAIRFSERGVLASADPNGAHVLNAAAYGARTARDLIETLLERLQPTVIEAGLFLAQQDTDP